MTNDLLGALFASEDGLTDFCQWLETDKNTTVKQKKTILEQLKELIQKAVERLKEYFNKEKFTDTQKAVSEMELKQAQQFRQQCLDILDHAISNLENGVEISNGTKNSTDPSKRIAKNRKSRYDEFNTLAMQWAYSNKTNVGDTKVFNKNGKNYVLIEATEDGYIEIASGNYEKVRNINERVYRKQTLSFGMHFEKYRADEGGNRWDFVNVRDRRTVGRVDYETEKEGFQNNTTRNIKSVRSDSEKPSAKVKYSLDIDSEGNKLSEQQQEYFKNSKVRDENGNLQVVYHGSPNDFTVFDKQRVGKGNDQYGSGFYFTTDNKNANGYGRNVFKEYLNITNPFFVDGSKQGQAIKDISFSSEQVYEIIKKHPMLYDIDESPLGDFYDIWSDGIEDYMIDDLSYQFDNLYDIEYTLFRGYENDLHDAIKQVTGNDGIQVNLSNEKFYVSWFPNQAKNTDNLAPTSNEDIRYSIDIDEFDAEDYTYPRLAKKEYNRLRREALAFNADKVNKIITQNLDNGYKYAYYFDDEYNLIVLGKTKSTNIHERYKDAKRVANGFTERFNNAESERGNLRGSNIVSENRRTDKSILSNVNNNIQKEGKSDRRGNAQNGNYDNLSEEKRYSIDIDEYDTRSLIKQNKQLQKSVEYYKMMLGYNSGHKVNRNKIRSYAVELKKQWNTALSTDDIADSLTEIFDFISSGNATWDSIESMGNALGKEIVYNIKQEIDSENQAVLDDLKQYTVSIDSHQRDEITYYYGGVGALTKKCE